MPNEGAARGGRRQAPRFAYLFGGGRCSPRALLFGSRPSDVLNLRALARHGSSIQELQNWLVPTVLVLPGTGTSGYWYCTVLLRVQFTKSFFHINCFAPFNHKFVLPVNFPKNKKNSVRKNNFSIVPNIFGVLVFLP